VPAGTARLRFTFTAAHLDSGIERLAALVRKVLGRHLESVAP
jgi:7-keto-8-aminopelargonate synthetase-like enzyme